MTEPDVGSLTQRIYDRLPQFMRDADPVYDWALLRYVSLVPSVVQNVLDLVERFSVDFPGDTSDLTDPATGDPAWLPWQAQFVGAEIHPDIPLEGQREGLIGAVAGVAAGTRQTIAIAARTALTGNKYLEVRDHEGGDPFTIGVVTLEKETPSTGAVVQAILDAHAMPAGFLLRYSFYTASWDTVEAHYPTWADHEAYTWSVIEQTL